MSLDVNISEPDEFNCNELHSCIEEIAKIKEIKDFSYHVDYVCGKGENFIANVFRVTITECEDRNKTFKAIVKTLINTTRQELFHELHVREVKAYEEVIQKFQDLQYSITEEDKLPLPKCLYTRTEKNNEVIVLEDLKDREYGTDNKLSNFERLDYPQARAVLKNLAKFHALSFIYEKRDPETFAKVKAEFQDIIFSNSFLNKSKLRNYFEDTFEMSLQLVENLDAKKQLERVLPKLLEILQQYTQPAERNVFCHGDCWMNNMMVHYEENEEPKVCFIDFQAMRYASPATDILHFIYLCTDATFRCSNFDNLLTEYYESLKSFLKLYGIEVNSVYTREDFDTDIKDTRPFGFLMALIEMKLVTTTPEDEAILKGSTIVPGTDNIKVPGEEIFYKSRVNDVVTESINNGVLEKLVDRINS